MCRTSRHLKGALDKGDCLAGARGAEQGQGVAAPSCPNQDRCYSFSLLTVQLLRSQFIQKARLPVHLAQAGQLIWFCPLHTHTFRCPCAEGLQRCVQDLEVRCSWGVCSLHDGLANLQTD